MYLQRVVDEHPDTPWAHLAKLELDTPIGWKWVESYTEPPRPRQNRPGNNNNNARPMRADKALKLQKPKQKRPAPKL